MSETFTRKSVTGTSERQLFATQTVILPDSKSDPGARYNAAQTGTAFLCQMPDGAQRLRLIDVERSIWPNGPFVLRAI